MIWSWAEVTGAQAESPTVHGAETTDYPPRNGLPELGPGRTWAECVSPQTVKKLLGWTELLNQAMAETRQAECPAPGKAWSAEVTVCLAERPATGGASG